jgi:hypothetical protein
MCAAPRSRSRDGIGDVSLKPELGRMGGFMGPHKSAQHVLHKKGSCKFRQGEWSSSPSCLQPARGTGRSRPNSPLQTLTAAAAAIVILAAIAAAASRTMGSNASAVSSAATAAVLATSDRWPSSGSSASAPVALLLSSLLRLVANLLAERLQTWLLSEPAASTTSASAFAS